MAEAEAYLEDVMDKLLYRLSELVEVLGLSRARVYELLREGTLPKVVIGRSVRVPARALEEWVAAQLAASSGGSREPEHRPDGGNA